MQSKSTVTHLPCRKEACMPNNTQQSSNLPPIDTSKIQINIIELDPPDYQFDIEVPIDLISEISARIARGGLNYNEQELGNLIVQVSQDEAMQRLDKDSAWGCRVLKSSAGKYDVNKPFKFSAITDTIPNDEFSIDTIPINRRSFEVSDSHVEAELLEQQIQIGERTTFEGALCSGDEITCDIKCTLENSASPIAEIENYTFRVPNENQVFLFQGIQLQKVGEALRTSSTSDELTLSFSNQGANGILELKNCKFARVTPATIEQVLEKYGTPNEALLRTQIKLSLQNNFDRENLNFMVNQFYSYLLDNVELPISKRIVKKHYDPLCQNALAESNDEVLSQEQQDMLLQNAERLVKRLTMNAWIQRQYSIGVSEDDIDEQITIVAEERRVRPAQVRDELVAADKLQVLANIAIDRKVFNQFKDKMVFTDIQ